jgi:hypothetical protein
MGGGHAPAESTCGAGAIMMIVIMMALTVTDDGENSRLVTSLC